MKRKLINLSIIATLFILLSTIIAPPILSEPIIEKINQVENNIDINDRLIVLLPLKIFSGLIDWLIELITSFIEIIGQIQLIFSLISGIIYNIQTLITAIPELFQMISDFINLLQNFPG
jgi:hypothetical protein